MYRNVAQDRIYTLRQAVDVIGFGTPAFQRSCKNLVAIQECISRTMPDNVMIPWKPQVYKEGVAIRASNRYFTTKKNVPNETPLDFYDFSDPSKLFRSLDVEGFVHTTENNVDYYRCVTEDGHSK